jgi:hypothetical protein
MLTVTYAECHKKLLMLSVVMLNVVILSVVILSVVAPWKGLQGTNTLAYCEHS